MQSNVQLSEVELLLIDYLKTSNAQRGTAVKTGLLLQEENQQLEMCRFLSKNPEATDGEIWATAQKISGKTL